MFRGHVPHFCNFVHKLQLHNKQIGSTDSTGVPDSEFADEIDLIAESVDGSLIGQWRKGSGARWVNLGHLYTCMSQHMRFW